MKERMKKKERKILPISRKKILALRYLMKI